MPPEIKSRLDRAAKEDGVSVNDWVLDAIEEALDARDAEVAADKRKADLEKRLDAKFEAIVAALAATVKIDRTSSAVDQQIELHELAVDAIEKWRSRAAANHHAEPKTALERLCRDYCDIEDEIARGVDQQIGTFEDDLIALEDEMDEPGDPDEE